MGSSEQILKQEQDVHQDLSNITGDSLLYQWYGLQKSKKVFFPPLISLPEDDIRKWIAGR